MQLDEDDLVNRADSHESLRCPICLGIFDDPVFAGGRPCQCTFCRRCIEQELRRTGKCPNDRFALRLDDLVVNRLAQDSIDALTVHCRNRSRGCYWTGRLDSRPGHTESCIVEKEATLRSRFEKLESQLRRRDAETKTLKTGTARLESQLREKEALLRTQNNEMKRMRTRIGEMESSLIRFRLTGAGRNMASPAQPATTQPSAEPTSVLVPQRPGLERVFELNRECFERAEAAELRALRPATESPATQRLSRPANQLGDLINQLLYSPATEAELRSLRPATESPLRLRSQSGAADSSKRKLATSSNEKPAKRMCTSGGAAAVRDCRA